MATHVFLQARTTSSRLPAKCFLMVGGMPSVVLAAKRLGNKGFPVTVLTSREPTDDSLTGILQDHDIGIFRGELDHLLSRYYEAAKDMDDDDVIIRSTADDLVPDGDFAELSLAQFHDMDAEYAMSEGVPGRGLPYGLIVECFYVRTLRKLYDARDQHGSTHVTLPLREDNPGKMRIDPGADYGSYSVTMDTLEDYLHILQLFEGQDSEHVNWRDLCLRLEEGKAERVA